MDSLAQDFLRLARAEWGAAPHPLTLAEASVCVKNPHVPCCAIANGLFRSAIAKSSDVALLGRARMPLGVREMRLAEPLAATVAILLCAMVARLIDA